MQKADHSPPCSPTIDQQRDALRKGLGRARQWAIAGKLDDDLLLAACLQDQRYDFQLEENRADWLWSMILDVGAVDRFRVPILHALYRLDDERSANQLVQLTRHYAAMGDATFHARLYEIVESRPFPEMPWLGEEEIVRLDGQKGFLFAAKIRGKELSRTEWDWDFGSLVNSAVERLGETEVISCLEAAEDPDLVRFRDSWREQRENSLAKRNVQRSFRDKMRAIPIEEVLTAARSDKDRFFRLQSWGSFADETDLEIVFENLWTATESRVIANLLRVFSRRSLPTIDDRIFALCHHPDPVVRVRAFNALENSQHPLVRDFALAELDAIPFSPWVVGLFKKNYENGDESKIFQAIVLPDDDDFALHSLLLDVIGVLEENQDTDCLQLGLLAYAKTPCENCRSRAALHLLEKQVAPAWLVEECRFDSCPELVEVISANRPAASDLS